MLDPFKAHCLYAVVLLQEVKADSSHLPSFPIWESVYLLLHICSWYLHSNSTPSLCMFSYATPVKLLFNFFFFFFKSERNPNTFGQTPMALSLHPGKPFFF